MRQAVGVAKDELPWLPASMGKDQAQASRVFGYTEHRLAYDLRPARNPARKPVS
jgi:hypothetical protein